MKYTRASLIEKLTDMGIPVVAGKVKKSDVKKALASARPKRTVGVTLDPSICDADDAYNSIIKQGVKEGGPDKAEKAVFKIIKLLGFDERENWSLDVFDDPKFPSIKIVHFCDVDADVLKELEKAATGASAIDMYGDDYPEPNNIVFYYGTNDEIIKGVKEILADLVNK